MIVPIRNKKSECVLEQPRSSRKGSSGSRTGPYEKGSFAGSSQALRGCIAPAWISNRKEGRKSIESVGHHVSEQGAVLHRPYEMIYHSPILPISLTFGRQGGYHTFSNTDMRFAPNILGRACFFPYGAQFGRRAR